MRAALIIAGSTIKCGLRSKGIWSVLSASVLPMIVLYLLVALIPDTLFSGAIQIAASMHGEDPQESAEMILEGPAEDREMFIADTAVSGSVKLIGIIGTAIAIFFTVLTNEAARKSLPHILAHPVPRGSIVAGSYLGSMAVTVASVGIMTGFAFAFYIAQNQAVNWGLLAAGGLLCIGMSVATAYCVLFSTALPSVLGVLGSFGFTWISAKTYTVRILMSNFDSPILEGAAQAWMWVFPRLGDFGTRAVDWAIRINSTSDTFDWADTGNMVTATVMAGVHIVLALGLASWFLNRKAV